MQVPPQHANSDVFPYLPSSGTEYSSGFGEQDRLSTYTGLNDYDTLFEARHGRGAIDNAPRSDEGVLAASSMMMPTATSSMDMTENLMIGARPKHAPDSEHLPPNQRGPISIREIPSTAEHRVVSAMSKGHILGEVAAIFTDMTETMLTVLDQQMAPSDEAQNPEGTLMSKLLTPRQVSSNGDVRLRESKAKPMSVAKVKDKYPDLYLPVAENYKISNKFYGYMDSMSADNNPRILVKLTGLSYIYGTTINAVDRVNGTMYGKFSVGFRVISERATIKLQYKNASLDGVYVPMQPMPMSTLPRMTQMVTPLAKSTPITQSSQMPAISNTLLPIRDILEPTSNKQARSTYLERQMRQMGSINKLPSDVPSLEDGIVQRPESLQERIQSFCWENKVKKKQEWESHRMALERMKESKEHQQHQQNQEERDVVYAQMLQNHKRTRAAVRSSISKASTISDEECWLALTEDDFLAIQWKMDRIDQKLTNLYRNWQAEYRSAITSEDCEEVKRFYGPYLEKYESKYRILYQMLQQANRQISQTGVLSAQEPTSEITPSLAALDNAEALRRRELRRGEPSEDIPRQSSTLCGHLTPTHLGTRT